MEVGAEEANPEERGFLGNRWQSLFNDIGGLVLALELSSATRATKEVFAGVDVRQSEEQMYQKASCQPVGCGGSGVPEKRSCQPQWQC